ncbi:MAG TPA: histidine kinase, partial [Amycolatopsis sp.]
EPRLGLFVVARLASRHGISVHLRESAYGGTRAIVLVRTDLLAPISEVTPDPEPGEPADTPIPDQPAVADVTRIGRRSRHRAMPPGPVAVPPAPVAVPPVPVAAAPQPEQQPPARPPRPPQPAWPAREPSPENGRPQQPRRPEAPGRPPLPQRRRQQNLVPQLRADRPEPEREETREDSPEIVRDRLAAFQQGTRRARATDAGSGYFDTRYGDRE